MVGKKNELQSGEIRLEDFVESQIKGINLDGQQTGLKAIFQGETQFTLSDFLVPPSLRPNPQMGATLLRLISDWSWITRRVEKIQIIADGQTRRRLSFDFTLPLDSGLSWNPRGYELGTIVPLTFLRKGPLVNLDIEDQQGNSVPVLSREENAEVVYQTLRLLAARLNLDQAASRTFNSSWPLLPSAVRQVKNEQGRPISWSEMIDKAIYAVIMSEGYDQRAVNYKKMTRLQDGHRYDLFSTSAQLCAIYRTSPQWVETPPPSHLTFPSWLLGYDIEQPAANKSREQEKAPRVLDSSPCVQVLACTILHEIIRLKNEEEFEKLGLLEVLCQFLALTSTSFLLTALIDCRDVPPSRKSSRQLMKIGCDVETDKMENALSSIKWVDRIGNLVKAVSSYLLPTAGSSTLIRHSKWSAASTHLEFQPPAQTRVTDIVAAQGLCLAEGTGFNDTRGLGVSTIVFDGGERIPQDNRKELFAKRGIVLPDRILKYRHGSYRTSQDSVHVIAGRSSIQAVDSLRFTIMPDLSAYQPLLAAGAAVCVTILSLLITFQQRYAQSNSDETWFNFGVFIGSETIILAIFGALLLTTGHNRTAQAVWAGPRRLMTLTAVISVSSPFLCLPGIWIRYGTGGNPRLKKINSIIYSLYEYVSLAVFLLLCYSLILFFLAGWMQKRCWDNGNSAREEKIIKERVFPKFTYRPYHNVVAVTETGIGHFAYLTDDFIRYFRLAPSLTEYRAHLNTIVKNLTDPGPGTSVS